jgi:hypothetical protein
MSLSADYAFETPPAKGITYVLNGSRFLMRFALKLGAVSLALVAVFVWVAPGASWESDVMLFKLALSIFAGFGAVAMWLGSLPVVAPSVEVDVARGEIRVMRSGPSEQKQVIERCAFADLHAVDLHGRHIIFWSKGERLLAEISLSDAKAHAALLTSLRDLGKLA